MNMQKMSRVPNAQAGFTLIELIVVIVILGILAATALPKFADLGGDARAATVKAARGSIDSVSAMVHGKFLIAGNVPVVMEEVTVTMTNGYPKADAQTMLAAGLRTGDYEVTTTTAAPNTPTIPTGSIIAIPTSASGTTKGATCYVMYSEAASATAPPIVSTVVTGC